ncbi:hypothetical protein OROHE_006474 [Orobanche hederae]
MDVARGESSRKTVMIDPTPREWKRERTRTRTKAYKKGDQVDLRDLLFTPERDYLIQNGNMNNKVKVKVEQLQGKVIVLHFVLLDDADEPWRSIAQLNNVYVELLWPSSHAPPRPFEVVLVAVSNYRDPSHQNIFRRIFLSHPWPAVPFSDSNARERLAECFVASDCGGGAYLPHSIVISERGVVLQNNALPLFQGYGAEGYPFSDERITHLASQDDEIRKRPSLKALLVSPQRDYVINNKEEKVNVSYLEDKVVALFLYEEGWTNELTQSLKKAYKQCVHRTNADSFRKTFQTMPWLALPFKDINCKKVMRVFRYPFELGGPQPDPSLVIIGHHGEIFEPFGGARVLMEFGIDAYPFTSNEAYKLQFEKVKNLKFEALFGPEAVFVHASGSDSALEEVLFSDIVGKTILVFSEYRFDVHYKKFKMKLQEWYMESKGTINEFEVIHLGAKGSVPWLTLRDDMENAADNAEKTFHDIFRDSGYGILVFDCAGKVVRARRNPRGFELKGTNFPSSATPLYEEVVDDLIYLFHWDFWERNSFMDD